MEMRLKILGGKHAGQEIRVPAPRFLIGRGEKCNLRPASELVSREHCLLEIEGGKASVRDLGSNNGTFVNGERIAAQRQLATGDRLTIGQLEFEVHLTPELSGRKRPAVKDVKDAAQRTRTAPAAADLDVAALLGEAGPTGARRDMQRAGASETSSGTIGPADETPPAGVPAVGQGAAKGSGQKPAGKLPPPPQAADSRSAAADMLKKLLNKKG